MEKFHPGVDAYIGKSAAFAQPILIHLRQLVHRAFPEIQETIKWGFPHFDYKGTVCSMAAFKQHCAFGFWKSSILPDPHHLLSKNSDAMGSLGRICSLSDLPDDDILAGYILHAARLNADGIKLPPKETGPRADLTIPEYFVKALAKNPEAEAAFNKFSYSHRKEYLEWITEAKTEVTREKRINTALEWMVEGKGRNWKYESRKN